MKILILGAGQVGSSAAYHLSREEANRRLGQNNGMVASFSRALTEGLTAQQSDEEFNAMLDSSIQTIFDASCT